MSAFTRCRANVVFPPGNEIPVHGPHQVVAGPRAHRVRARSANQPDHRLGKLRYRRVEPQFALDIFFVSDRVEMPLCLFRPANGSPPLSQVALHRIGKRRSFQTVGEDIVRPLTAEIVRHIDARVVDAVHVRVIIARNAEAFELGTGRRPFERARNLEFAEQLVHLIAGALARHAEIVRRLRPQQTLALHQELVLLAVPAEHAVIFQQQAARSGPRLLVVIRGAQPAKPRA